MVAIFLYKSSMPSSKQQEPRILQKKKKKQQINTQKEMIYLLTVITFTLILRVVSGTLPFTCDKIKDFDKEKDNQNRYLVMLKDPKSYQDAQHVIGLVDLYQWSLEMNAGSIHEPLVKSSLEVAENMDGLQGTLSEQALLLVISYSTINMCI